MINVYKAVELWGIEKTAEMVAILRDAGSKNLLNEFTLEITEEGEFIESTINAPEEAYYASEGRDPGNMPDIKAIENWAAERGIDKAAAYPIAENIAKFGTRESGLKFLDKFKYDKELNDTISAAYLEDIKIELTAIIEKYNK